MRSLRLRWAEAAGRGQVVPLVGRRKLWKEPVRTCPRRLPGEGQMKSDGTETEFTSSV